MPERPSTAETSPAIAPSDLARRAAQVEACADALTGVSDAWILGTPPPPGALVAIADDLRASARALAAPDGDGPSRAPRTTDPPPAPSASPDVRDALARLADRLDRTRETLDAYLVHRLDRQGTAIPAPPERGARDR